MAVERIKDPEQCPDYWKKLGMVGLGKYSRGEGVKLAIVDSCILETHNVFDPKKVKKEKSKCDVPKEAPIPEIAHGTAMASLIVGLPRKNLNPVEKKVSGFNSVCGIANKATLYAYYKNITDGNGFWDLSLGNKKKNKKFFPSPKQPELHVMSWSLSSIDKGDWVNKLNNICRHGGLLIASAGNDGLDLNKKGHDLYPSTIYLNETSCSYEPRIIVANQDQNIATPTLNQNSNYGSQHVHIAAPGTDIPQAIPHFKNDYTTKMQHLVSKDTGYYDINSGTSPATAIVSATAALIMKCNRHLTAAELRNAILDSATSYTPLKDKVENGRTLCTAPIVEAYCLESKTSTVGEFSAQESLGETSANLGDL